MITLYTAENESELDNLHIEMLEIEEKEQKGRLTKKDFNRFSQIVGQNITPSLYRKIFLA
ncbi:MAG: hypothetical protein ACTH6D_07960 [Vibrio litoralis]